MSDRIPMQPLGMQRRTTIAANSSTPESKVLAAVKRWAADKHDVYVVRVVQAGESGVPDLLLCVRGIFVGVECKAHGKPLRPIQAKHGDRISLAEGVFLWGDDLTIINELNTVYTLLKED